MSRAAPKTVETKSDAEKPKRVYRAALETIQRLESIIKQKKGYRNVFSQDAVGLRSKLKEYCEWLMFYNPLEYGRKAEEVLWRKVHYETIQLIKHNRRHIRHHSSLETAFRTHLAAGSGYYYHLLFRIQSEFSLHLDGILDFYLVPGQRMSSPHHHHRKSVGDLVTIQEWATRACHRCIICLGDIARYQLEFDLGQSSAIAERYYYQALVIFPENGLPHNQLGTLAGSRYYNCEAAYHYIQCFVSEKPFAGAQGNLQRLFEKNYRRYTELTSMPEASIDQPRPKDVRRFFINFMHLLAVFLDPTISYNDLEIQQLCEATLQDFNLCMFYEPSVAEPDEDEEEVQYLDNEIIFKIVVICMAVIYLLQKQGSSHMMEVTAFLLALVSHVLNHVVIRLQSALYEKENPSKLLHTTTEDDPELKNDMLENHRLPSDTISLMINETAGDDFHKPMGISDKLSPSSKKPKHVRPKNLRRRRRRHNTGGSDSSPSSKESDLSEGEAANEDALLSDSDEDVLEFADYDSDTDLFDSLMDSQELPAGFSTNPSSGLNGLGNFLSGPGYMDSYGDVGNIWADTTASSHLAQISSELFLSSNTFLGQNLKYNVQNDNEHSEQYQDIIEGRKEVAVPPGFAKSSEANYVAVITQKLNSFVIETDTEASLVPTDTEQSSLLTETEGDTDDLSSEDNNVDREAAEHQHLKFLLEVLEEEGLLPIVKVFCDWMRSHPKVIISCSQSCRSLWCRLSMLLNMLPTESDLIQQDNCWPAEVKALLTMSCRPDWQQDQPFREDINLRNFPPLACVHGNIDFNAAKQKAAMSEQYECIMRVCCLRQFGYYASDFDGLEFKYQEDQNMFFGPNRSDDTEEDGKIAQKKMMDAESRRNQLMRDMAQLRLQAEVTQLEGSLKSSDHQTFPPYLVTDTSAVCEHLSLVRQLTQCGRCILVIPTAVIDTLDMTKKESQGARDAIRWLEAEFKKGNRYIRAQKSNEKIQSPTPKNLKKKNKDAWCTLEILACCRYLAQQSGELSSSSLVAVLSNRDLKTNAIVQVKQMLNTSQMEGITVENIVDFHSRWKDTWKSRG